MTTDERLDEISKKLDKFLAEYEQDKVNANRDKYLNLGYIALGFALATVSLVVAKPDLATAAATIVLLVIGIIFIVYARRYKLPTTLRSGF